jgi:hypothetical protein
MRFWLRMLALHLVLGICALWMIQHVASVHAVGWTASMGLVNASKLMVAATIVGLGVVYLMQIRLVLIVARLWTYWYRARRSN